MPTTTTTMDGMEATGKLSPVAIKAAHMASKVYAEHQRLRLKNSGEQQDANNNADGVSGVDLQALGQYGDILQVAMSAWTSGTSSRSPSAATELESAHLLALWKFMCGVLLPSLDGRGINMMTMDNGQAADGEPNACRPGGWSNSYCSGLRFVEWICDTFVRPDAVDKAVAGLRQEEGGGEDDGGVSSPEVFASILRFAMRLFFAGRFQDTCFVLQHCLQQVRDELRQAHQRTHGATSGMSSRGQGNEPALSGETEECVANILRLLQEPYTTSSRHEDMVTSFSSWKEYADELMIEARIILAPTTTTTTTVRGTSTAASTEMKLELLKTQLLSILEMISGDYTQVLELTIEYGWDVVWYVCGMCSIIHPMATLGEVGSYFTTYVEYCGQQQEGGGSMEPVTTAFAFHNELVGMCRCSSFNQQQQPPQRNEEEEEEEGSANDEKYGGQEMISLVEVMKMLVATHTNHSEKEGMTISVQGTFCMSFFAAHVADVAAPAFVTTDASRAQSVYVRNDLMSHYTQLLMNWTGGQMWRECFLYVGCLSPMANPATTIKPISDLIVNLLLAPQRTTMATSDYNEEEEAAEEDENDDEDVASLVISIVNWMNHMMMIAPLSTEDGGGGGTEPSPLQTLLSNYVYGAILASNDDVSQRPLMMRQRRQSTAGGGEVEEEEEEPIFLSVQEENHRLIEALSVSRREQIEASISEMILSVTDRILRTSSSSSSSSSYALALQVACAAGAPVVNYSRSRSNKTNISSAPPSSIGYRYLGQHESSSSSKGCNEVDRILRLVALSLEKNDALLRQYEEEEEEGIRSAAGGAGGARSISSSSSSSAAVYELGTAVRNGFVTAKKCRDAVSSRQLSATSSSTQLSVASTFGEEVLSVCASLSAIHNYLKAQRRRRPTTAPHPHKHPSKKRQQDVAPVVVNAAAAAGGGGGDGEEKNAAAQEGDDSMEMLLLLRELSNVLVLPCTKLLHPQVTMRVLEITLDLAKQLSSGSSSLENAKRAIDEALRQDDDDDHDGGDAVEDGADKLLGGGGGLLPDDDDDDDFNIDGGASMRASSLLLFRPALLRLGELLDYSSSAHMQQQQQQQQELNRMKIDLYKYAL